LACWCDGKCPHLAAPAAVFRAGHQAQAGAMLRRIIAENPGCGEAHMLFAHVLQETNHASFAVPHMDTAQEILGPLPRVLGNKANVMRNAVRLPAAIAAAREAVTAAPDNPMCWAMLADHLQAEGATDEMADTMRQAAAKFGRRHPGLRRMVAVACMELKDTAGALDALAGDGLSELDLFERGRALETAGAFPEAWRDWMAAKAMQRARGCNWNRGEAETRFAMLADGARPRRLAGIPRADLAAGAQPVFICGQPRSGTTMIEAALSAHPRIAGGDEMMMLPDLLQIMPALLQTNAPYPLSLGALRCADSAIIPNLMRDFYLRKAAAKIGGAKPAATWFTDKMPSNELHWPLLGLLFPESPIIATRRHPLDVVVSNMAHHLVHGGFISCSLEGFAANFAMVSRLLDHYRKSLPWLKVRTVPYEKLVADHRAGIDALLPPGAEPDSRCYDFHLSPWKSRTISHRQIKKPVNDKSVGRWRNFADFLKPVLEDLRPIMEGQGYGL